MDELAVVAVGLTGPRRADLAAPSIRLAPKHSAPAGKPSVLSPVTNTVPLPGQTGTVAVRPGGLVSLVSSGGTATLPAVGRSRSGAGTRGATKAPGGKSKGGAPPPRRRAAASR